jgi:hypothetical protein
MYAIAEFSNDFNPANLSNPSSLQINSQLVAIGAGGRGEALISAPTPSGVQGVSLALAVIWFLSDSQVLKAQGGPPLPPAPPQKFTKKWSKIESKKTSDFWPQMASQRDPQNLKNLTKSAKWQPRTPFESSFGRFHFRKGFQVAPKDLQNLKNDGFT